jgi:hypothetical protein
MKNKILCEESCFDRIYIEYVSESTARHTSFVWSYELKKFVPYDTHTFKFTDYDCNTWENYVETMLKVRPNMKLI